jgi:hypothetical protein
MGTLMRKVVKAWNPAVFKLSLHLDALIYELPKKGGHQMLEAHCMGNVK